MQREANTVALDVDAGRQVHRAEARVVEASTHVGLEAGRVKVVLNGQRGRQVAQAADAGIAGGQGVLLGHGENQFSRQVGAEKVAEIHFRQPLVVDVEPQAGGVLVDAVQMNGTGTHEQRACLEVLRQSSARSEQRDGGHRNDMLLHDLLSVLDTGISP